MKYQWFERGAYATSKAKEYLSNSFNPNEIKKIAVIRHAALGDQVIVRPFLIEARKFFPNAKITLVAVSNYMYGVPDDLVDHVHVMPGKHKDKKKASVSEKIKNIKELGSQDIIFDLASTNRSHWMMALSKATLKIGFPYKYYLRGILYNVCVPRSDFQPEVECMLDMLKLLGHYPQYPLNFAYPDNRVIKEKDAPYILYFNGASQKSKIVSQDYMKELISRSIAEHPDYIHIFLEGKNNFEKGDFLKKVVEKNDNCLVRPLQPLDDLIELTAKATLLISPDTGVRNVGISTHTPTVGIFYSTVPYRYTPHYEKHFVAMSPDGSIPDVGTVCNLIKEALCK
ncbi:glycosyltransferase family 9 protein [Vibrio salinus]|uniref:glycosyltransferase family 9 protein n=1 Tax=Vibrio salinus TaxID=2899784 RepID=UPI001E622550|nr:glycosyltransferase family 9 protein [Vibrio salinus]MCE0493757.1 glycosyltransferase family 9 protein [Vibrio salinus]